MIHIADKKRYQNVQDTINSFIVYNLRYAKKNSIFIKKNLLNIFHPDQTLPSNCMYRKKTTSVISYIDIALALP